MATQRNEIITVLSIDARDLEAKAASITSSIGKLEGKIVDLTNGVQGYSTQVDNAAKVTARQASSLEGLLSAVDPVYAAHKKLADEQARLESGMKTLSNQFSAGQRSAEGTASATAVLSAKSKELVEIQRQLRAGHLSAEEALVRVHQTMTTAAETSKAMAGAFKLSYESQQVLRSGVINTFQSISAGLPIGQTLLTQTTQTAPAFAEMAKNAGLSTTAMIALGVPMAAAVATIGSVALKLVQASSEMRSFTAALKAGSQQAQVTAADLEGMVTALSHRGVARSDAVSILSTVSSVQQSLSKSQISQIADLAPDMAVKFGDAAEAFKKAVGYLTAGIPGIRQAYEETGALSLAQYEAARAAYEHGNRTQALQIVLDGLKQKFDGLHHEALTPTQAALENIKTAYDDLATTAASHPITIKILTTGGEWLQGFADFLKNPSPEQFAKWQLGSNPMFGGGLIQVPKGPEVTSSPQSHEQNGHGVLPPLAPAGTPVPGVKPSVLSNGMTPKEAGELSDLRHANDLLAQAMKKVGAERQIAVAGAQAYTAAINAGKSPQAAQNAQLEAERMARVQLSAAIADQTAQITIQARESLNMADAYMQSAAAGERAAAMRQAQLDSLQSWIDVETRYRQILNERAATQAATSAQALQTYQQEVAGREAVANATMQGVEAGYAAEMAEKVRIGTLTETIKLENASGETAEKLRKIIEEKTAAILDDERAQKKQQIAQAIQQQKDQLELGQAQLRLMGASAEQRAVEIARLQAIIYLRNQHRDIMDAESQAYIKNAEAIARQSLETDRLQAAYQELERFGDQAFSSVIDAVVKGGDSTKTWANAVKGLATEFQTLALKMAVLNPIKNAVFGTNLPTAADFFGGGSIGLSRSSGTAAAGGTGGMGMLGTLSNIGSLGSLLGGGGGIGQSIISGASEAVFDLTGSAGLSQGIGLGLDASPWGIIGSLGANLLGLGGKGGIGGMVGGTLGSVAGGALGGTMLGAELGMAAGPIGAVAGAFLGTVLGGMFGPGKSVGPNSAVAIGSGVGNSFGVRNALADNGGSTDAVRQVGASVASTINAALTAAGRPIRRSVSSPRSSISRRAISGSSTAAITTGPSSAILPLPQRRWCPRCCRAS
ncbi:phage tail tape measure protein [Azospirillum thermophilum]|uniref:Bacteriophage tail tape measure N-terminal domain-containing protein n=1 Tax=Azospirillum thermophilum TaxID=2202148 RepID=A0A2S2CKJ9_9PROT|nr:phage tail tape measure protein [Azospirillum thermophilum]AWK85024.1 hypothetical protein DEW08_01460 [Azospirillum thermophilum]